MARNRSTKLSMNQSGAIISAAVTAIIHLYLSFQFANSPNPIFFLNGIGYLLLLIALYGPIGFFFPYRGLVRWLLMGYAALTIVLWVFWGVRIPLAYFDKLVEIALIIFLWLESQQAK